jgi:glycosidase
MTGKYLPRANPLLYEINTASWLFELSRKHNQDIHLGEVPPQEWDRLKMLGMDYVWLMGVWNRSQEGRKVSLNDPDFHFLFDSVLPECQPEDIIGSCYSISSYDVDPLVGTLDDIDRVRAELRKRNMGLILDFVPNHTGVDHHWIDEHPDYYIQVNEEDYHRDPTAFFPINSKGQRIYIAHGRDPNFPSWTDTAQLNYFNPATRQALLQRLEQISQHCDGLRCDMAMLLLNDVFTKTWGWANQGPKYAMPAEEFWTQATTLLPDLIWIAEAYWDTEWTLQQSGFDYAYDKRLYDRLRYSDPHEVFLHLKADLGFQSKLLRFIENHDELRSITAFGLKKTQACAVLFSALPGMKLYFHGQLEGKTIRLPLQIRQSKFEPVNDDITAFYDTLLSIINCETFHSGDWKLKEVGKYGDESASNVIAQTWNKENRIFLFLVNLSHSTSQGIVHFQDDVSELQNYSLTDKLSGQSFTLSGKLLAHPGLRFSLKDCEGQVLEITPLI